MRDETKLFLNTWGAYNSGSIGYGWMTPEEARKFIQENPNRDGGEWFIADIDNYLGIDTRAAWGSLDYANVSDVINDIEKLEELNESELKLVNALIECYNMSVDDAIDSKDDYLWFSDRDSWEDFLTEQVELEAREHDIPSKFLDYFDYSKYIDNEEYYVTIAANGVVIYDK